MQQCHAVGGVAPVGATDPVVPERGVRAGPRTPRLQARLTIEGPIVLHQVQVAGALHMTDFDVAPAGATDESVEHGQLYAFISHDDKTPRL